MTCCFKFCPTRELLKAYSGESAITRLACASIELALFSSAHLTAADGVGPARIDDGPAEEASDQTARPNFGLWLLQAFHDCVSDATRGLSQRARRSCEADVAWDLFGDVKEVGGGGDGMDAGDMDVVLFQLEIHGAANVVLSGFGGRICGGVWQGHFCHCAAGHEQVAGLLGGNEALGGELEKFDGGEEIHLEDVAQFGNGGFMYTAEEAVAGVGEDGIEAAEFQFGGIEELLRQAGGGDIAGDDFGLAAELAHLVGDGVEAVRAAAIQYDVHAGAGAGEGGGGADAGSGAGDDDGAVVKILFQLASPVHNWLVLASLPLS